MYEKTSMHLNKNMYITQNKYTENKARFCHLLWHPACKPSGTILV